MASHQQTRIQAYLEKNKIGPLFEELMTKLITETPDQPIPFLIDHLQSKQGNRGQLQRTLSGSAALWAESETSENKGTRRDFRNYDKPWQVNAKKPKKSKSDLAVSNISPPSPESKSLPRSIEHPKWDWKTKPENHDFDELNHILQESKKLGKALESLSRSIAISDELEKDTAGFNTPLLRPRVIGEWIGREENDADPLAAEMLQPPIPRNKNEQWDSEDSSSPGGSLKMEPKTKGLKHQQQQHKKLLAAMLSQDSFDSAQSTAPSVTEEDIDNEDDAMELLEDLDDLRMEGVTSVVSSGSKFNQTRSAHTAEPQAKVTLNICARCARLQGDNLAERPEDVSMVSQTSEPAVSDSDAQVPGVETLTEDINEFQSASQVAASRDLCQMRLFKIFKLLSKEKLLSYTERMNSYNSFNLLINLGYCRVTQKVKEWKLTKTNGPFRTVRMKTSQIFHKLFVVTVLIVALYIGTKLEAGTLNLYLERQNGVKTASELGSALTVWTGKDWDGLGEEIIESNLGVLVGEKLDMNWQCGLVKPQGGLSILGCIRRGVASRLRKVILPLYSALVRPHLEFSVQASNPQHKKRMDLLE
ncbi:hypothetical protein DUI87_07493 [Hirundo rustica rustica]|uniref:Vestibule 1 n=1 Tax=Hirundo rustica rustica TaxID=333673 RepID=A0A3M0KV60_HIRRU|nr:hypothetical protein DUI87_07493 [Hirundo rustica rustica]